MSLLPGLLAAVCCVTGQVTYVAHDGQMSGIVVPADGSSALWFAGENNGAVVATLTGAEKISPGDQVIVRGQTSSLGFAPGLAAEEIVFLGAGTLSRAQEVFLHDLDWGVRDNQRVALRGVLTSVRPFDDAHVGLSLDTRDGSFLAVAPTAAADWRNLIDATLRLEGSAMSRFNIRGEFIGVLLQVVTRDGVEVLEMADDPFAKPLMPLNAVTAYSPSGPDLHRRHVRGVVTYVKPGEFLWLADGTTTLKVRTTEAAACAGDIVEAIGFVTREYGLGSLESATVRVVGHGELPEAVRIGWVEFGSYPVDKAGNFLNFDGRRVWLEGRLLSCIEETDGQVLTVEGEKGYIITVRLDGRHPELAPEVSGWGSSLRLTGVIELVQKSGAAIGQMPGIEGWTLRVSSPDDVDVLHNSAWVRHMAQLGWRRVLMVVVALVMVAFILVLIYFIRLRSEQRRLGILTTERKRMAADLHDTLEQHLAGARMMLNSAVAFTPDVPEGIKNAIAQANELLAHAKSEMRARIFDMRSDVLFTQGPEKVLRSIAEKVGASGVVHVRTRLRGLPERLPEQVFSELVFVVQEALTNAVKHGRGRNIVLTTDPRQGGFFLIVANDGEPFDPAKALGPEAGHYGLAGMRERAKRAGFGLEFTRIGRWMTVRISVTVPSAQ